MIYIYIFTFIYIYKPKTQRFVFHWTRPLILLAVFSHLINVRSSLRRCCNALSAPLPNAVGMANPTRFTIMIEALLRKQHGVKGKSVEKKRETYSYPP